MDYLSGGDLRYHLCRHRYFNQEITRFFVACLISGLEYVHAKNVLHRDIKPENLVLDEDGKFNTHKINLYNLILFTGYLRITDFGIAREWREENS